MPYPGEVSEGEKEEKPVEARDQRKHAWLSEGGTGQ
jgi:hypothetical protein